MWHALGTAYWAARLLGQCDHRVCELWLKSLHQWAVGEAGHAIGLVPGFSQLGSFAHSLTR